MLLSEETEPRFFELQKRGFIRGDDGHYLIRLKSSVLDEFFSGDSTPQQAEPVMDLVMSELLDDFDGSYEGRLHRLEALKFLHDQDVGTKYEEAFNLFDGQAHSCYSDAYPTPSASVHEAAGRGIKTLVAVEHDTFQGIEERLKAAEIVDKKVNVIPAIEVSFGDEILGQTVNSHICVLFPNIDYSGRFRVFLKEMDRAMLRIFEDVARVRHESYLRLGNVFNKLNPEYTVSDDEVLKFARGGFILGSHYGMALFSKYKGQEVNGIVLTDTKQGERVFAKGILSYSNEPAIVASELKEMMEQKRDVLPDLRTVEDFARRYHGVIVLGHPPEFASKPEDAMEITEAIADKYTIGGIAVYPAKHEQHIPLLVAIAEKINRTSKYHGRLVYTGESDTHGNVDVPEKNYGGIKQKMGMNKDHGLRCAEIVAGLKANCFP